MSDKLIKTIAIIFWMVSALSVFFGFIALYGLNSDQTNINIVLLRGLLIIFAMSISVMTPFYFNLLFRDVYWKTQKEIDELRFKYNEGIQKAADVQKKLTKVIYEYESKNKSES